MNTPQKNRVEWTVFWLSLALVLGVGGFLLYDSLAGDDSPPLVVVTPGLPTPRGELVEVPVYVENRGGQAAQEVLIELTVRGADGAEETAELTLPLLPRGGSEEGVVTVPLAGRVEAVEGRVVGYTLP